MNVTIAWLHDAAQAPSSSAVCAVRRTSVNAAYHQLNNIAHIRSALPGPRRHVFSSHVVLDGVLLFSAKST